MSRLPVNEKIIQPGYTEVFLLELYKTTVRAVTTFIFPPAIFRLAHKLPIFETLADGVHRTCSDVTKRDQKTRDH